MSIPPVHPLAMALQAQGLNVLVSEFAGELSLQVEEPQHRALLDALHRQHGYTYFADLATVDHFTETQRFEIIYNLFNLSTNHRLRVKVRVEESQPELDSVHDIWPAAAWHEREAWDMMGIRFRNHPDLRRMFLPEDFAFHPHRKEFPLIGIPGSLSLPEKEEKRTR